MSVIKIFKELLTFWDKCLTRSKKLYLSMQESFVNLNWIFVDKITRLTSSFFVGIYVARYLGTDGYGVLTFVIAFGALFKSFTTLIHRNILIKEIANKRSVESVLASTIAVNTIATLMFLCIFYFVVDSYDLMPEKKHYIFIYFLSFFAYIFLPFEYFFKALNLSKFVSIGAILSIIISSIFKVFLVINNYEIKYFFYVYVAENFIYILILVSIFLRRGEKVRFNKTILITATTLLSKSLPLFVSSFFIAMFLNADSIMLNYISGSESLGIYAAAVKISSIWYVIPSVVTIGLFSGFSTLKDPKLFVVNFNSISIFFLLIGLLVTIFTFIFSEFIVFYLYGIEFNESVNILKIHVLSLISIYLTMQFDQLFVLKDRAIHILYGYIIAVIFNVYLNYTLIPTYGGIGAAIATVAAYYLKLLYSLFICQRLSILKYSK
jgi:O-antigen/teichoic acid export membrane protein